MKYIYFQRIRLLKNKIAAELRVTGKHLPLTQDLCGVPAKPLLSHVNCRSSMKDLLLDANIAASSGFATATLNVGKLRNNGFELTLETTNVKTKDFNWTSNFNIAFNKNKIISLNSGQEDITSYLNSAAILFFKSLIR